jgi:hypothetical protein
MLLSESGTISAMTLSPPPCADRLMVAVGVSPEGVARTGGCAGSLVLLGAHGEHAPQHGVGDAVVLLRKGRSGPDGVSRGALRTVGSARQTCSGRAAGRDMLE